MIASSVTSLLVFTLIASLTNSICVSANNDVSNSSRARVVLVAMVVTGAMVMLVVVAMVVTGAMVMLVVVVTSSVLSTVVEDGP